MKKKAILIGVFLLLMLATVISACILAEVAYREEVANCTYELKYCGFPSLAILFYGALLTLYELDLLVTLYYFLFSQKKLARTILNVLSNLSLVLALLYNPLSEYSLFLRRYEVIFYLLFLALFLFRSAFYLLGTGLRDEET